MTMQALRGLLATGCVGVTLWSAANASWEARISPGFGDEVMDLGLHPLWSPPPTPEQFTFYSRSHRTESRPVRPGDVVTMSVRPAEVAVVASVLAWPVLSVLGVLYLVFRGRQRDIALHCAGSIAVAQVVALVACVVSLPLWISVGGWPHLPLDLFGVGTLSGLAVGLLTYTRAVVGGPEYVRPASPNVRRSPSQLRTPVEWPGAG